MMGSVMLPESSNKILSKWLSFIILRTTSNANKVLFKIIEKIENKLNKLECHLNFNQQCLIYIYWCKSAANY